MLRVMKEFREKLIDASTETLAKASHRATVSGATITAAVASTAAETPATYTKVNEALLALKTQVAADAAIQKQQSNLLIETIKASGNRNGNSQSGKTPLEYVGLAAVAGVAAKAVCDEVKNITDVKGTKELQDENKDLRVQLGHKNGQIQCLRGDIKVLKNEKMELEETYNK